MPITDVLYRIVPTRTPEEAAAAWDQREVREPYKSRDDFLAYCAGVQEACKRLGLSPYGSNARVVEVKP